MAHKSRIIFSCLLSFFMLMLFSCDDKSIKDNSKAPEVVTIKIDQPAKKASKPAPKKAAAKVKKVEKSPEPVVEKKPEIVDAVADHYDAKGKIDPFKSLIQDEPVPVQPAAQKRPARMLTPLEKIELSQVKLVAVLELKDRRIAMVEESNGKGYEVEVGTYIGKNGGKITQIKKDSIVVNEPVRDFKGKLSEKVQEIKLNKNDFEE